MRHFLTRAAGLGRSPEEPADGGSDAGSFGAGSHDNEEAGVAESAERACSSQKEKLLLFTAVSSWCT